MQLQHATLHKVQRRGAMVWLDNAYINTVRVAISEQHVYNTLIDEFRRHCRGLGLLVIHLFYQECSTSSFDVGYRPNINYVFPSYSRCFLSRP